ncbi:MAG TPA: diguanylate cyclase [Spirochaetota bacterium]
MKEFLRSIGIGILGAFVLSLISILPFFPPSLWPQRYHVFVVSFVGGGVFALSFTALTLSIFSNRKKEEGDVFRDKATVNATNALINDQLQLLINLAERSNDRVGIVAIDIARVVVPTERADIEKIDSLIAEFVQRVHRKLRKGDLVIRKNRYEFIVLLAQLRTKNDIEKVVRKIRYVLCEPFMVNARLFQLDGSFGAAQYPDDGYGIEALLDLASKQKIRSDNCPE